MIWYIGWSQTSPVILNCRGEKLHRPFPRSRYQFPIANSNRKFQTQSINRRLYLSLPPPPPLITTWRHEMNRTSGRERAKHVRSRPSVSLDRLPTWDPNSDVGKREARRERLSADAVHVIPLVITLCLALLWFFSLWYESSYTLFSIKFIDILASNKVWFNYRNRS